MIKILLMIFVIIVIFTSSLYLWILDLIWINIEYFKNDFIPYIPVPLRLVLFMIVLGIWVRIGKTFTS